MKKPSPAVVRVCHGLLALAAMFAIASCSSTSQEQGFPLPARSAALPSSVPAAQLPQLSQAVPAGLLSCTDLVRKISFANTVIVSATIVPRGTLKVAGKDIDEHCLVKGRMRDRIGPFDGMSYAIGFEMRMPQQWNGRFFYQANGGLDGSVLTATGPVGGGGPLNNALNLGFAVLSSDAGHLASQGANFGVDPQARLDYGYQAVGKLTPMAKGAIQAAYGKGPDRSYIGGCSNGGRHALVAAARYGDQFDGYLSGDPGIRLPLASTANMAGARMYAALASTPGDLASGFTQAERSLVKTAILAKCDALDGARDGLVQDTTACQAAFTLDRDVPVCRGARDGSCLSAQQKAAIDSLFVGATTRSGVRIYTSFPYDAGLDAEGWASWKFGSSLSRDPATGIIFQTPPDDPATFDGRAYALTADLDGILAKINATNAMYAESAMSFMTPPHANNLSALKIRGAKIMVYHGTADPIFSSDDTTHWYEALQMANGGDASNFARFYRVPGMNHCSGGPATDQFDMLTPLVNWVEKGQAPEFVIASARGLGNAAAVSTDVPADWSASRTRPLCPYPKVARYSGVGDLESAANFVCK